MDQSLKLFVLISVLTKAVVFVKNHLTQLRLCKATSPDNECFYIIASTKYRALRRSSYSRKQVERLFSERVLTDQTDFVERLSSIVLHCIVSIDETHISRNCCFRKCGRLQRIERSVLLERDPRTTLRTTTKMAVYMPGRVHGAPTMRLGQEQTANDWQLCLQAVRPHIYQRLLSSCGPRSRTHASCYWTT